MKKRIFALLLVLAMAMSLAACSAPAADSETPSAAPTDNGNSAVEPDLSKSILEFASAELAGVEQVMTVNGQPVSNTLFSYLLALSCSYFENTYYFYGYTVADYAGYILNDACSMAVYYTLMEQKAAELGCPLTDEQIAAINAVLKEDLEADPTRLTMFGLTEEDMHFIYSMEDTYENVKGVVLPEVTEEDLNDYVYHVKHILIATAASAADGVVTLITGETVEYAGTAEEYNAEALAKAESILAEIRGAADMEAKFDELMNKYSEDGRDAEGNLSAPDGYTAVRGDMVTEFEEASLQLEIGGLSGLVKSSYGYHIILRSEVENIGDYTDKCIAYKMDAITGAWMQEADVVLDDVLNNVDAADFYERYIAWQNAFLAENPEEE